ncbi:MAG: hypothetical protein ACREB9_04780 [Thermoplasmata archaeon]
MSPPILPPDDPLRPRLEAEEARIAWRRAPGAPRGVQARIAHLHDEEARVERRPNGRNAYTILVDSGPVGALALLLEIDRAASTPSLSSLEAGQDERFPHGALVATWAAHRTQIAKIGIPDLIALARYALR